MHHLPPPLAAGIHLPEFRKGVEEYPSHNVLNDDPLMGRVHLGQPHVPYSPNSPFLLCCIREQVSRTPVFLFYHDDTCSSSRLLLSNSPVFLFYYDTCSCSITTHLLISDTTITTFHSNSLTLAYPYPTLPYSSYPIPLPIRRPSGSDDGIQGHP